MARSPFLNTRREGTHYSEVVVLYEFKLYRKMVNACRYKVVFANRSAMILIAQEEKRQL